MPEVGNMSIPKKLLDKGVTDMVRISDGRMSGTGFGTVVLHVSPEASAGGTIAVIEDGDIIELDHQKRSLRVLLSDEEIAERKKRLKPFDDMAKRGYVYLYQQHVEQAHLGADLDFLKGGSGSEIHKDSH
jgi:dihydroxy-acid dehydratase